MAAKEYASGIFDHFIPSLPTTATNNRHPMTSCSLLVVTMGLSRLTSDILTT